MPQYHYPIYDTAQLGTTANSEHTLFQSVQGSSTGGNAQLTNMRGNGQFPSTEGFEVHSIGVHMADVFTPDDIQGLFNGSYLRFELNNFKVLEIPLYKASDMNDVNAMYSEATATDFAYGGQSGAGFDLKIPIMINGGVSFIVTLFQGLAVDVADSAVVCVLDGILTTSN